MVLLSPIARAQSPAVAPGSSRSDVGFFLLGGAFALAAHEAGHVAADLAFDAGPGVKKVSFARIPFFAITHRPITPGREFIVSSSGFWVQEVSNEILLTRRPRLRDEDAALLKGMLAFNTLASIAYAGAAFAGVGPGERDTRGMARSARVGEPSIGALVLAPAVLDAARYYHPERRWLVWASRASKVAGAALAVRAAR
jgi:hypothetical protein